MAAEPLRFIENYLSCLLLIYLNASSNRRTTMMTTRAMITSFFVMAWEVLHCCGNQFPGFYCVGLANIIVHVFLSFTLNGKADMCAIKSHVITTGDSIATQLPSHSLAHSLYLQSIIVCMFHNNAKTVKIYDPLTISSARTLFLMAHWYTTTVRTLLLSIYM